MHATVLTISSSLARGEGEDESGPRLAELLGEAGCEQGHIVFEVPTGGGPTKLKFKLDYSRPDPNGGSTFDTHVRLEWSV